MKWALSILLAVSLCAFATAQEAESTRSRTELLFQGLSTTISSIGQLESRRDPKCYATASRLEDFMYGSPLTEGARFRKTELQKDLVHRVWKRATARARDEGSQALSQEDLQPILDGVFRYKKLDTGDWVLELFGGEKLTITQRDARQYSSIAYGLRAILAVQQERILLAGEELLPFDSGATALLKEFVDLYTLAALQLSDRDARIGDRPTVGAEALARSWNAVGRPIADAPRRRDAAGTPVLNAGTPFDLTREIVKQKIASYEAYNDISMPVFLRNIQVYFARHRWPQMEEESARLRGLFTEVMIVYSKGLMEGAAKIAREDARQLIRVDDVSRFLKVYLPHEMNVFEDATFFPRLAKSEQVMIDSYDMDAFRDGGLHWQYLVAAVDEPDFRGTLEPDPFALELVAESIAQFGVLVLRVAGDIATELDEDRLSRAHVNAALRRIQERITASARSPERGPAQTRLASAPRSRVRQSAGAFFTDVTAEAGLNFNHRSSDWLNRLIRSYLVRDDSVAVLAVPPAFGGSGAAAEDINGDGFPDLLLLSGSGNRLFLNDRRGGLRDITEASGIAWVRDDRLPGEPRQPIIADFDNDGMQDIFISYVDDPHRLYRNVGGGRFEDVTARAGLGGKGLVGGPATAMDFDKDGRLDLYVTYFGQYIDGIVPTLSRRNENGLPNKLFRNVGGMRFEDVTEGSGVAGSGWTQATTHTDFNLDGWQDLIEGNDFGINAYYQNRGDGTFENVAAQLATDKPSYTMSVGIADLNGDLHPDIYISNIVTMDKDQKYVNPGRETRMKFDARTLANVRVLEANDLFLSQVGDDGFTGYAQSTAVARGRSSTGWAWGADFFDFDNDGDDDLYVANGMNEFSVYATEHPFYEDPAGGEMKAHFPKSARETNVFFVNEEGKLLNESAQSGADLFGNSRAVVYLDLDADGDLDMVLNNYHEPAVVLRNNSERLGHRWLTIKLVGDPEQQTTRDAIGARLVLTLSNGTTVWREIHGGVGYLTMHPKEQYFGLGDSYTADVTVHWPSGEKLRFADLKANNRYVINQRDGSLASAN